MTKPSSADDLDYLKGRIYALERALAIVGLSAESPRVRSAFEESLEQLGDVATETGSGQPSRITEGVSSSLDNIRELLRKGNSG